ncbi:MAG: hypothetical protein KF813_04030 [Trueperaceae bacterium]|nr:hypothetical protein [Trueperaceae bacterium]
MKLLAGSVSTRFAGLVLALTLGLSACGTTAPPSAAVRMYTFPAFTHSGGEIEFELPIAFTEIMESVVLAYAETTAGFWYQLPAVIAVEYTYRIYYHESTIDPPFTKLLLGRTTGTGDHSFAALKVVVIPVTTVIPAPTALDLTNYAAVKRHFSLAD